MRTHADIPNWGRDQRRTPTIPELRLLVRRFADPAEAVRAAPSSSRTNKVATPGERLGRSERRRLPRTPLRCEVTCHFGDGIGVRASSRDISCGGMFIDSDHPAQDDMEVTLFAVLPDQDLLLKLSGLVRWCRAGGFAVEFDRPSANVASALASRGAVPFSGKDEATG